MSAFDELLPAAFDNIVFPVKKVAIKGGIREHTHEYPKSPGGSPEKLGRKLYMFTLSAVFSDTFKDEKYKELWPDNLALLRVLFESEKTADLHIPTIGTIKAFCVNWSQEMEVKMRSGETAEFEFKEDQSSAFLLTEIINVSSQSFAVEAAHMVSAATDQDAILLTQFGPDVPSSMLFGDVFKGISGLVSSVQNLADNVAGFGNALQSKVDALVGSFEQIDVSCKALSHPVNAPVLESFLTSWQSAVRLQQDTLKQSTPLRLFVVPATMSVTDVSRTLYGSNDNAVKLMQLNAIEDPFRIPAGSELVVLAA